MAGGRRMRRFIQRYTDDRLVCMEHTGGCDRGCVLKQHMARELICDSSCLPDDPVRAGTPADNTSHRYSTNIC